MAFAITFNKVIISIKNEIFRMSIDYIPSCSNVLLAQYNILTDQYI